MGAIRGDSAAGNFSLCNRHARIYAVLKVSDLFSIVTLSMLHVNLSSPLFIFFFVFFLLFYVHKNVSNGESIG